VLPKTPREEFTCERLRVEHQSQVVHRSPWTAVTTSPAGSLGATRSSISRSGGSRPAGGFVGNKPLFRPDRNLRSAGRHSVQRFQQAIDSNSPRRPGLKSVPMV